MTSHKRIDIYIFEADYKIMGDHFKSLEALVKLIKQSHKQLQNGELNESGLNEFIETVQDLQERLVIMRFKAYEGAMGRADRPAGETKGAISNIDLRNQISLIDAIEEEVQKEVPEAKPMPSINFSAQPKKVDKPKAPAPEIKLEPSKPIEPAAKVEEVKVAPSPEPKEPSIAQEAASQAEQSLNEKLSEKKGTSLNEKLKKTPIADLSKAIGINQKYQFINELFKQNADHYNQVIGELNKCNNYKEALTIVRQDPAQQYNWEEDDRNVLAFMDLVERRYLN